MSADRAGELVDDGGDTPAAVCVKCESPISAVGDGDEYDSRAGGPGALRCSDHTCPYSDVPQPDADGSDRACVNCGLGVWFDSEDGVWRHSESEAEGCGSDAPNGDDETSAAPAADRRGPDYAAMDALRTAGDMVRGDICVDGLGWRERYAGRGVDATEDAVAAAARVAGLTINQAHWDDGSLRLDVELKADRAGGVHRPHSERVQLVCDKLAQGGVLAVPSGIWVDVLAVAEPSPTHYRGGPASLSDAKPGSVVRRTNRPAEDGRHGVLGMVRIAGFPVTEIVFADGEVTYINVADGADRLADGTLVTVQTIG